MIIFVVVVLLMASYVASCPTECSCSGDTVDCGTQSLTGLPAGIPATTTALYLQGNNFPTLTTDMFSAYTNLVTLQLDSCSITTVEPDAFNGLTALTELSLSSNAIQIFPDAIFSPFASTILTLNLAGNAINSLSTGWFSGMVSLTSLDLSSNQLNNITADVFADLSAVTSFTLEGNVLVEIGSNSLSGLSSINGLNLHNNLITSIEAGAFSSLTDLRVINLNNNELTTFVPGVFASLHNLEEINFQSNKLDTLTSAMFSDLPALETIRLRNNLLSNGHDAFGSMTSVTYLDLSGNVYTAVSGFFLLSGLRTLDLSENRIVTVTGFPFAALTSIQTINLRHNQLTSISDGAFGGLEKLQTVDLSFNNLTAVPSSSFAGFLGNTVAQDLILSDNQIQSIATNAFVSCQNARTIDLRRNLIDTLNTNSFANLEQIRTIYLSNNLLAQIPELAFKTLVRLETVHLDENRLEQVNAGSFQDLDVIATLNISNNIIHTIADDAFQNTPLLAALYVNANKLTAVPKGGFSALAGLQILDLSYNTIGALGESKSFGDLNSLSVLNLRNNSITSVAEDCLSGLPALSDVDMSFNSIAAISVSFAISNNLSAITSFNLANNELSSLSSSALVGFTALETLDISQNVLTTLPNGLLDAARTSLSSLIMSGNSWQCDCALKWLQEDFSVALSGGVCSSPADELDNTLGTSGTWIPGSCEVVPTTPAVTVETNTPGPAVIPLTITTAPYSVEVDVGQIVSIECNAIGTLPPTVAWTSPTGNVILTGQNYNFDQTTGTLNITGITSNMAGVYHCNADNAAGDQASIEVTVVVRFPPAIVQFSDVSVMSDSSVTLVCKVNAFPLASIQWTTPDGSIVNENSTGSLIVTSSGTLHMANRNSLHSGLYTCLATNPLGYANSTGYLYIYNSTSSYATVTRAVNVGDRVMLTCAGLVSDSDAAFAWSLPSGHTILYSTSLTSGQNSLAYLSPTEHLSYRSDGSTQSLELDYKFSVDTSDGSLTINSFSTFAAASTDAVSTQAGSYVCRTLRGVYNYVVEDATVTTVATTTTALTLVNTSEIGTLTDLSIYYIVLGVFLLIVLLTILVMVAKLHQKQESDESKQQLTSESALFK